MIAAIAFVIQEKMKKANGRDYRRPITHTADFYGLDPYEAQLAMRELPSVPRYR